MDNSQHISQELLLFEVELAPFIPRSHLFTRFTYFPFYYNSFFFPTLSLPLPMKHSRYFSSVLSSGLYYFVSVNVCVFCLESCEVFFSLELKCLEKGLFCKSFQRSENSGRLDCKLKFYYPTS